MGETHSDVMAKLVLRPWTNSESSLEAGDEFPNRCSLKING
jgi:hypothetical protein